MSNNIPTAQEMSDSINAISSLLLSYNIITSESYSVLCKLSASLKRQKEEKSWKIIIDRDNPIKFERAKNFLNESADVIPILSCEKIAVNQQNTHKPPFECFDISMQINDLFEKPISRWHFDLANKKNDGKMQAGPLTHLQYGGHIPNLGIDIDHPIKVPRWCHPPLDVVLLCEVIVANFFPREWDLIKENPSWCLAISMSQKLCYTAYVQKLTGHLSTSSTTILNEMDASVWY